MTGSLIPRTRLFGNPARAQGQISPDGRWLSWLAPEDGVLNIWVAPTGNIGAAIGDEIAGLEKQMRNKNSEYWRGANAEKLQARYRELVGARERMGGQKAA